MFPIRATGVSTKPIRKAAAAFIASLTADQTRRTVFDVDDPEWRTWVNVDNGIYVRVRCDACGEIVQARINPTSELSLLDDGEGYFVRKVLIGRQCYRPIEVELDEFIKAGGSAKCLTLRLDGEEAASWKHRTPADSAS